MTEVVPEGSESLEDKDPEGSQAAVAVGQIRHLAAHTALLLSSGVVGYGAVLGLNIVLARQLGAAGFGAWAVAFSVASTFSTIGLVGADWTLQRHGSYFHGIGDELRLRRTLQLALLWSGSALIVLAIGIVLLAPTLAHRVFHSVGLVPLLRLAGLMLPVSGLSQLLLVGTRAFKSMKESALIRNIVQPMARLIFATIALFIVATPVSAFVGLFCAEFFTTCCAAVALHRKIRLFGPTAPVALGEMGRFALPAWGTKVIENLRGQIFPLLLGSLATLSATGAFVATRRISVAPTAIIAALNTVYAPMVGDLDLQNRRSELEALFKSVGKWSFTLGLPLFCYQVAFPKEILSIFGGSFQNATPALIVLGIGMLFSFGTGPVTVTLIVSGRAGLALFDYFLVIATEIGLSFWLIPSLGVLGAAIANAAGLTVNNVLPLWQVWRGQGFHPYRWDYWKPTLAAIVATLVAKLVLFEAKLPIGVTAAAVAAVVIGGCYTGLVLLFGLGEDREVVDGLIKKVRRRTTSRPAAPPTVDQYGSTTDQLGSTTDQ
ncbi:MAG: polysaccharide biosynthesis C-terminal domain-containing protein [Actinomycetota bacterium]|nr:polysaccharide biosynthesis C-terminal domain-containing protein [Actinomycetota bacterium]